MVKKNSNDFEELNYGAKVDYNFLDKHFPILECDDDRVLFEQELPPDPSTEGEEFGFYYLPEDVRNKINDSCIQDWDDDEFAMQNINEKPVSIILNSLLLEADEYSE